MPEISKPLPTENLLEVTGGTKQPINDPSVQWLAALCFC